MSEIMNFYPIHHNFESKYKIQQSFHSYDDFPDTDSEDIISPDHSVHGSLSKSFTQKNDLMSTSSSDSIENSNHFFELSKRYSPIHITQAQKCRQLPCRTFISTGCCPYGDKCVFLHDLSIVSKPIFSKNKVRT